jgi:hypothetical protein
MGVMGAGIALEFKNRYSKMFDHYKIGCSEHYIKPGDCYVYYDDDHHIYILSLAVKKRLEILGHVRMVGIFY